MYSFLKLTASQVLFLIFPFLPYSKLSKISLLFPFLSCNIYTYPLLKSLLKETDITYLQIFFSTDFWITACLEVPFTSIFVHIMLWVGTTGLKSITASSAVHLSVVQCREIINKSVIHPNANICVTVDTEQNC